MRLITRAWSAIMSASGITEPTPTGYSRPSGMGESSGGWIVIAIVLVVIAGLTVYALRRPGGGGGKHGFGPLGAFGGEADDGLGRKWGGLS